jgi:hypothetical protein
VSLVLAAALLGVGVLLVGRLDIMHSTIESHRFLTAALVVTPALAALGLAESRATLGRRSGALVLAGLGAGLGAFSTVEWVVAVAPSQCDTHAKFYGAADLYAADCRAAVGAPLFARPEPLYVEAPVMYLYAGCTPAYLAAAKPHYWSIQTFQALAGDDALLALDERVAAPGATLAAVCQAVPSGGPDRTCDYARAHHLCGPRRAGLLRCSLPPDARRELVKAARDAKLPPKPPPKPPAKAP